MAATQTVIEEFLQGPLVSWLATCVKRPNALQVYETFFDGGPFTEVLLQIDPEPSQPVPYLSNLHDLNLTFARIQIFHSIVRNIKNIYEEELGQLIVSLPDFVTMGRSPGSEAAVEQFKLLLILCLGCAVQGPTKEKFITKIKLLPFDLQHDIVECIKQVTDDQNIVLTLDWTDQQPQKLYNHLRTLTGERDKLLHQWMQDLSQDNFLNASSSSSSAVEVAESNHLAVELADWKARLRKQRQELEDKTEVLAECREELTHANTLLAKYKAENNELIVEARLAKTYQDEVDAMREKIERAERLELEVQRYREKLADAEFYKVRVDELREDNKVLLETREMLEIQLARARQRSDHVLELEAELLATKQKFNEVMLEKEAAQDKIRDLIQDNLQLQQVTKSALQETSTLNINDDMDENDDNNSGDNSLSEQLTNNAQARALRLELENKKLLSIIDSLKEKTFYDNANKVLDLEKDNKKLGLKYEQVYENNQRLSQEIIELENIFKNAIQENKKLQDSIDASKMISERSVHDLQNERSKIGALETNMESLTKEKQRIQMLCNTITKRADDAEKNLALVTKQLQNNQIEIDKFKSIESSYDNLKDKFSVLEKENSLLQKDVVKFKELLEAKDVTLDMTVAKSQKQEKEIQNLSKEFENSLSQLEKLLECEQKAQELTSRTSVYTETIATLQKDLITEKLGNEKFKNVFEKLGLSSNVFDSDIVVIIEQLLSNSNVRRIVTNNFSKLQKAPIFNSECCVDIKAPLNDEINVKCQKLTNELANFQSLNDSLQTDNAKYEVEISTLKSHVNSLQTQQTALQLANSQLVAEKDELNKHQQLIKAQHETLIQDQITLRRLHEQLSVEYEQLKSDQESLKKLNRDVRSETRSLQETIINQKDQILVLNSEKESLEKVTKNLSILRTEHSKLKDDFRNLFSASERLKVEYKNVQKEFRSVRNESRTMRLAHTEMQGELNSSSDLVTTLQFENANIQQKCDMLFEMNHSLDSDRRALMDHVSQLLSQYHSLLTQSLEDKQQYHLEEKQYTDKVNNLCRQKEKLEEKIMEHYRKLDNASSKKKSFGANLVKKVRKAGSDIISKVPSRNRRSWQEDPSRVTNFQYTLGADSESGNDSETSIDPEAPHDDPKKPPAFHEPRSRDEVVLRNSQRDMSGHRNSIAGSRRTVYLSEEEPNLTPTVANVNQPPPVLVYNRISTVFGETTRVDSEQQKQEESVKNTGDNNKLPSESSKETAVWYEYGCV